MELTLQNMIDALEMYYEASGCEEIYELYETTFAEGSI